MNLLDKLVLTRDGDLGYVTMADDSGWHHLDDDPSRQYRPNELLPITVPGSPNDLTEGGEKLVIAAQVFGVDELKAKALPRKLWQRLHCHLHRAKDVIQHGDIKVTITGVGETGYEWTLNGVKQLHCGLTDAELAVFVKTGELPGHDTVPELRDRLRSLQETLRKAQKEQEEARVEAEAARREILAATMREKALNEQLKRAQDEERQKKQRDEELTALKKRVADLEGFWLEHRGEKPAVPEPAANGSRFEVKHNITPGEMEILTGQGYEIVQLQFYEVAGKPMLGGVFKRSTTVKVPELVPVESEAA